MGKILLHLTHRRLAALEEREKGGHSTRTGGTTPGGPHPTRQLRKPPGMSQADWDIQQRLEKLKEKTPAESRLTLAAHNIHKII